ncbi:hypothetical protein PN499_12680 [Kamptonema animale CS-326]|uniref:hypothetical protein n=1 Tax=Kamptonema animale TaxID=92934 RepID=UPI00232AD7E1|nr:hypothetical protein [Kamptonema animale]MDB9512042.1 hypothetical protein [Kamptonema animale CS-326]
MSALLSISQLQICEQARFLASVAIAPTPHSTCFLPEEVAVPEAECPTPAEFYLRVLSLKPFKHKVFKLLRAASTS